MTDCSLAARLVRHAVFLAMLAIPRTADACRCLEPKSASAAYAAAHAAVTGKVISIARPNPDEAQVTIEVTAAWKADLPRLLRVTTSTSCAFPFESGTSYLLFLFQDARDGYSTERCMGNRETAKAASYVSWLKKNGREGQVTPPPKSGEGGTRCRQACQSTRLESVKPTAEQPMPGLLERRRSHREYRQVFRHGAFEPGTEVIPSKPRSGTSGASERRARA